MIEDIKAGPFDAFFKVEGCEFPILRTSDMSMLLAGRPFRVSNTGGFFSSEITTADDTTFSVIVVFDEVLELMTDSSVTAIMAHEEAHIKLGHTVQAQEIHAETGKVGVMSTLQFELDADSLAAKRHGAKAMEKAIRDVVFAAVENTIPKKVKFRGPLVKALTWFLTNRGQVKARRKALLS